MVAAKKRHKEVCRSLLSRDDIDIDDYADKLIFELISVGDSTLLEMALSKADNFNFNSMNGNGWTALICAISYEKDDILELLLQQDRLDVREQFCQDNTAFTWAVKVQNDFAVEKLILFCSKREIEWGLNYYFQRGRVSFVGKFVEWLGGMGEISLIRCSSKLVEYFFKVSRDPNLSGKYGVRLLMAAAFQGNYGLVHHLIASGADPNLVDFKGRTALYYAMLSGMISVVHVLMSITNLHLIDSQQLTDLPSTTNIFLKDAIARILGKKVADSLL